MNILLKRQVLILTEWDDHDMTPAEISERAAAADAFARDALFQKYQAVYGSTLPLGVIDEATGDFHPSHPLLRWNLVEFVESYITGGVFDVSLLPSVLDCAIDLKLQLYFITEVDLGMYNRAYFDRITADPTLDGTPWMLLTRMSIDQTIIGKSRVLWERLMNLVFLMETGVHLETKRSKKRRFFSMVKDTERWRFLEPYEAVVVEYDDRLRTPEYHKFSVLRGEIFGKPPVEPHKIMELVGRMMNVVWDNILSIVRGGGPVAFTDLHMGEGEHSIDERYLSRSADSEANPESP